jgi:hypothetical protein
VIWRSRTILLNTQDGKAIERIDVVDDHTLKYHQALLIGAELVEGNIMNNQTATDIQAAALIKKQNGVRHKNAQLRLLEFVTILLIGRLLVI